jgi:hypothetical protein
MEMRGIRQFFLKNHSFSILSLVFGIVGFLVRFLIMMFSLGVAQQVALPTDKKMSSSHWILISGLSLGIVLLDYIKDYIKDRARRSLQKQDQILFSLVSGSIYRLIESRENHKFNFGRRFTELLNQVESVIKLVTKKSESQGISISANIMVVVTNSLTKELHLKHWGTKLANREDIIIPIDIDNPAPGAGLAFISGKNVYVHNILADEFKGKFNLEKDYRSILSIPFFNERHEVCGIVNIDSTEPDFFHTDRYIAEEIIPKLKPLIYLITLERDNLLSE